MVTGIPETVGFCYEVYLLYLHLKNLFMARILTGIQSSGRPHLGNLLGAIIPAIILSEKQENESLYFIADLHSLITIKDREERENNTCRSDTQDRKRFYA